VGGYLGFAQTLDTALRGQLGNQLVMRVRAARPSYWVGETFNTWLGESWVEPNPGSRPLQEGSPFVLPPAVGSSFSGEPDLQTFYVESSTADLVFHAESASELWFPSSKVFFADDGTIVSPIGLGSGSIYSVESLVDTPTAAQLRGDLSAQSLPSRTLQADLQLPHPYPAVQALAQSITARDATTYDKVVALMAWMGRHTRYSTDIPPLPRGADSVDEFLFGNRVGFCEQISTSLAVMLRSLGIPAREAVGYVPGGFDPITDLYQVHADDAHAWVQVWFPGYGWQSFDPTAVVPATAPSPGATALRELGSDLRHVPWVLVAAIGLGIGVVALATQRWRRRPLSWAARVTHAVERAGSRGGRTRRPSETLPEYARALDDLSPPGSGSGTWDELVRQVEASAYGAHDPTPQQQRDLLVRARRTRVRRSRASDRSRASARGADAP
jgi:transglutaminase-like putative cysteine protease